VHSDSIGQERAKESPKKAEVLRTSSTNTAMATLRASIGQTHSPIVVNEQKRPVMKQMTIWSFMNSHVLPSLEHPKQGGVSRKYCLGFLIHRFAWREMNLVLE